MHAIEQGLQCFADLTELDSLPATLFRAEHPGHIADPSPVKFQELDSAIASECRVLGCAGKNLGRA